MRPLPAHEPDLDRRWVTRVPPDPHVRFRHQRTTRWTRTSSAVASTCASAAGDHRVALDTASSPPGTSGASRRTRRSRHWSTRGHCASARGTPGVEELVVEQRPLSVYDQLIA